MGSIVGSFIGSGEAGLKFIPDICRACYYSRLFLHMQAIMIMSPVRIPNEKTDNITQSQINFTYFEHFPSLST